MGGKKSKLVYVRKAPEEKKTVVIVVGNDGSIAAKILRDNGIKALNIKGGMMAWNQLSQKQ